MNLSPEAEKAVICRENEIHELNRLWTRLCRLRGEKVSFVRFDREIMKRFHTSSGRDSLSFDAIRKVKQNLENSITLALNSDDRSTT